MSKIEIGSKDLCLPYESLHSVIAVPQLTTANSYLKNGTQLCLWGGFSKNVVPVT